ncbi:hypothetical protein GCM10007216_15000 [Thalassobacillus devorans]|uniref:Amidohydrolase-related domain-containing protein n=1 Tax=Thalassobacillus devorans TaxID=279813 RepID=A0ABQ1NY69_9BACI|nr:amidohydrolase family protein [Thalassobacillus devorans]NIK28557.1 hypothetical protein [Thalassobacillus devorans]GGC85300.1 hypothetical protein GCM10007216_15000 [Thalassobacillus devorans]
MRIIDMHHHILNIPNYTEQLIERMDQLGIEKVCLSGLGLPSDNWLGDLSPDNEDVREAITKYPDRIIGFGVIRLGESTVDDVVKLHQQGFKGIKTTRPLHNYDDPRYDEVYGKIAELGMPILFHTGFILNTKVDARDDVSTARMRPEMLDRVARTFPDLYMFLAHLGMPWHEEAAMMARFHPNVYVDLSGSPMGWRNRKSPNFFQELFYWEGAFSKIVFGTDVHFDDVEASLNDHKRIFDTLNINEETQEKIFSENVASILDL